MEIWKKNVLEFTESNDWVSAIEFSRSFIIDNPENVDGYINIIYLLHHVLSEEDYDDNAQDEMMKLLPFYFQYSLEKFINSADYCFFLGKLLWASEWFFGINEGLNKHEQTLAFKLENRAVEIEPQNELFIWSVKFTEDSQDEKYFKIKILNKSNPYLNWLVSKGFAGMKIIDLYFPQAEL
jgi:hypothetical protein